MNVLLVDDDPKLRGYLGRGLADTGHTCTAASDGDEALGVLQAPESAAFDVILLDVMMPARTGWDLVEELRRAGNETPVIFVTARDAVEDRVRGLQLGADDYVVKPFAFSELLARMEAVVRRRQSLPELRVADLTIDLGRRIVSRGGRRIDLSPREFDLLRALAEARGAVLTRKELLKRVWGIDFDPGTNVVDVHVARLRRRLRAHGPALIHTVVGQGYRLSAPSAGAGAGEAPR